ncbi:MAG: hypothetical protein P8I59_01935 [Pseudomonadales bacterium]|nr:hypothetical protein [Pseudomonadales bacterium]
MRSMLLQRQILPRFLMALTPVLLATKAVADTLPLSACASEPLLRVERTSEVKRLPIVRSIVIRGEPVFDPSRETLGDQILNGMNRLHWQTRESVIQQQLLFAMGTRVSPSVLAESARLLRSRPYLMEASIKVRNPCESEVDVEVTTRDAWSLTPRLALNRSGGNSKTGFGVREKNVLGLGIQVEFKTVKNLDRQGQQFELSTKHLFNTRVQSSVYFENNDDGDVRALAIGQPFYALDTRKSWGLEVSDISEKIGVYQFGERVRLTQRVRAAGSIFYGISKGLKAGRSHRVTFGLSYEDQEVLLASAKNLDVGEMQTRKLVAPFVQWSSVSDQFLNARNFDLIGFTEDIETGLVHNLRLAVSPSALGGDQDRLQASASVGLAVFASQKGLLRWDVSVSGIRDLEANETQDIVFAAGIRGLFKPNVGAGYHASLYFDVARNVMTGQQLFLGGETGARGYIDRLQAGDRRLRLRLERRQYLDRNLFGLMNLGWLVFADVGRAWTPDDVAGHRGQSLMDVGLGLRLAPTKAERGKMIHLDFAVPVKNRDDPLVSDYEFVVSIQNGF